MFTCDNKGVGMDSHWIAMIFVWAIVELVQFLRKRPFPARMKTGAWWAFWVGFFVLLGRLGTPLDRSPLWGYFVAFAMNGVPVAFVYWVRILLSKGLLKLRQKPREQTNETTEL